MFSFLFYPLSFIPIETKKLDFSTLTVHGYNPLVVTKNHTNCSSQFKEHFRRKKIAYSVSKLQFTSVHLLCLSRLNILVECDDKSGILIYRPIPLSQYYDHGFTVLLVLFNKCCLTLVSHMILRLLIFFADFEFDFDRTRVEAVSIITDLEKISGLLGEMKGNFCLNDMMNTFLTQQEAVVERVTLMRRYNIPLKNILRLVLLHLPSDDIPDAGRQIPEEYQLYLSYVLKNSITTDELTVLGKFLNQDALNTYTRDQLQILVRLQAKRFNIENNESCLWRVFCFLLGVSACTIIGIVISLLTPLLERFAEEQ